VMLKHYARVNRDDFDQIDQFTREANQTEHTKSSVGSVDESVFLTTQKASQQDTARGGKPRQESFYD